MMKLQKFSALKALDMKLVDENEDEYADVTTGNAGTNQIWVRSIPEVHNHDE